MAVTAAAAAALLGGGADANLLDDGSGGGGPGATADGLDEAPFDHQDDGLLASGAGEQQAMLLDVDLFDQLRPIH